MLCGLEFVKERGHGALKILVIFTGGTIGSSVNCDSGYLAPDTKNNYLLLERYRNTQHWGNDGREIEFAVLEAYTLLSENLNGAYLTSLCHIVNSQLDKDYDGIIVTHGSDTLQYAAAALTYSLGEIPLPVVLVCSNYVLTDERANGLDNFAAAVEWIEKGYGQGVFVAYTNEREAVCDRVVTDIHRGSRLLAHRAYDDRLYSVKDMWYGKLIRRADFTYDYAKNPSYREDEKIGGGDLTAYRDGVVRLIQAYPGMNWRDAVLGPASALPKAIVLQGYHSGTLPTALDDFREFALKMKEKGIPIYLCGSSKDTAYESAAAFHELGIIILEDMAPIAAYIWVWKNC